MRNWQFPARSRKETEKAEANWYLLEANQHLQDLIQDTGIPSAVKAELSTEFDEIAAISRKLEQQEIHIAVFGRVGVGKSSLLNAFLQKDVFASSPLHGETQQEARESWCAIREGHLILIDTPGIDELDGAAREEMARSISRRADIILLVCEADLTDLEFRSLRQATKGGRTVLLVLNKSDRYSAAELKLLMQRLQQRCEAVLRAEHIIAAAAEPRPETVIRIGADDSEEEFQRARSPDIAVLQERLWELLEKKGKSLAALNAALFASELDQKVASRIVAARQSVAEKIIRNYCLGKGLVVAVNPVPVADLLAAAGTDVTMVIHLGEVYGFSLSRREASKLLLTISAQLLALMGAYWGMNLVSSAMKTISAGLSTTLTAAAQGALAWYATYLTGKMAQTWFSRGKSWGKTGPRDTARAILASLDRESILSTARKDILARIKSNRD